jgi:hypothetical protein
MHWAWLMPLAWVFAASGGGTPNATAAPDPQDLAKVDRDASPWLVGPRVDVNAPERPRLVVTQANNAVLLPADCFGDSSTYDVVIHFHGIHTALEPAMARSGLHAAMLVLNDGIGASVYSQKYQFDWSLPWLLKRIHRVVQRECPMPGRRVGRVALSAWSAGYAAVWRILLHPETSTEVDAVLLADGLHARVGDGGELGAADMRPFLRFAREAVAGKKLFAITHSEIPTPGYASTTETADYLLAELGMRRVHEWRDGPRPGMMLLSSAERGWLSIEGYVGISKRAHADHQWAMGSTLLPRLREWWTRR